MTRRLGCLALMALGLVLTVLGCGARRDSQEAEAASTESVKAGERVVGHDAWVVEQFTLEATADVQVTAVRISGPAVDLFVMDEASFNKWNTMVSSGQRTEGMDFEYFESLSLEGLSASYTSDWVRLEGGTYYLVIDNTVFGGTAPPPAGGDDGATVRLGVESRPSSTP